MSTNINTNTNSNTATDAFIEFILANNILSFGDFTLKSGRKSAYFFNAGAFDNGVSLAKFADFYVDFIVKNKLDSSTIFAPAYKGIAIAVSVSMAFGKLGKQVGFSFNRKEAKQHGEKGMFVGSSPSNDMILLDDVITAGTAMDEILTILQAQNILPKAILVAIDRQEKNQTNELASKAISKKFSIPVYSLINLKDIINYASSNNLLSSEQLNLLKRS